MALLAIPAPVMAAPPPPIFRFVGGAPPHDTWTVDMPAAPELEVLDSCGRQVGLLEQQQLTAEGRGLERCIARERDSCELRIRATEEAASHLDCIICRQRCPDGSIP